jgi:hypothetical protein
MMALYDNDIYNLTSYSEFNQSVKPNILKSVTRKLEHLMNLEEDWDSYGGRPTEQQYAYELLNLLSNILEKNTNLSSDPFVAPLPSGRASIVFKINGSEISIETLGNYKFSIYINKPAIEREWDISGGSPKDIDELQNEIRLL